MQSDGTIAKFGASVYGCVRWKYEKERNLPESRICVCLA